MQCLLKALSIVSLHASLRRSRQLCSQSSVAQTPFSYELMKQQYRPEVPEYFNFASDVLDRWTEVEKVTLLVCSAAEKLRDARHIHPARCCSCALVTIS